jgi:hypothetical protein
MARVVGSESIATGDFILVSHSIREYPTVDRLSQRFIVIFPGNHTKSTVTSARTPIDLVLG